MTEVTGLGGLWFVWGEFLVKKKEEREGICGSLMFDSYCFWCVFVKIM